MSMSALEFDSPFTAEGPGEVGPKEPSARAPAAAAVRLSQADGAEYGSETPPRDESPPPKQEPIMAADISPEAINVWEAAECEQEYEPPAAGLPSTGMSEGACSAGGTAEGRGGSDGRQRRCIPIPWIPGVRRNAP